MKTSHPRIRGLQKSRGRRCERLSRLSPSRRSNCVVQFSACSNNNRSHPSLCSAGVSL